MLESEASYTCPSCFETQWIGVDPTAGRRQQFTQDCPVCCRPIAFRIVIDRAGDILVESAERE